MVEHDDEGRHVVTAGGVFKLLDASCEVGHGVTSRVLRNRLHRSQRRTLYMSFRGTTSPRPHM
jgi:hypothetical protein